MFQLRSYQQQSVDSLFSWFDNRLGNPLLVLPTGAGKSIVQAAFIKRAVESFPLTRFVVVSHVKELLQQNAEKVKAMIPDVDLKFCSAGIGQKAFNAQVLVCGIQTAYKYGDRIGHVDLVIIDECFSGDTEVMTDKGFVRLDEVTMDHNIAQASINDLGISFSKPIRIVNKKPESEMYRMSSKKLGDWYITGGHEMIVERNCSVTKRVKAPLRDINFNCFNKMYSAGYGSGHDTLLTSIEKFYLMFHADGNLHKANKSNTSLAYFAFSKERKINLFIDLMDSIGWEWNEISGSKANGNVKPKRRFSVKVPFVISKNLSSYFNIKSMSAQKAFDLISYANNWDGHVATSSTWLITSTDKSAIDFYQSICVLAGMHTNLIKVVDDRSDNFSDCYRLFIRNNDNKFGTQRIKKDVCEYDQNVYCVTVPDGNIVVRKNGSTIITGNCHLLPDSDTTMYRTFINDLKTINPKLKIIGMTATPYRLSSGLMYGKDDSFFAGVAHEVPIMELINQGHLTRLVGRRGITHVDLTNLHTRAGEFIDSEVQAAFDIDTVNKSIVKEVVAVSEGKLGVLMFSSGVDHAHHLAEAIQELTGERVEVVSGSTPRVEREKIINDYKNQEYRWLINYGVLTTGFDAPHVDLLVLCRATKSTGLYVQILGRAMRLSDGKDKAIVLDYGGNIERHGAIDRIKPNIPDGESDGEGEAPIKECPECVTLLYTAIRVCPECGHEFPPPEPELERTASNAAILSEDSYEWWDVRKIEYRNHEKRGGTNSMRVIYHMSDVTSVSEWICFNHTGFARRKAEQWSMKRGITPPSNVDDALVTDWPTVSRVYVDPTGRFPQLIDIEFGEIENPLEEPEPPPFEVPAPWNENSRQYDPGEIWSTEEMDAIPF